MRLTIFGATGGTGRQLVEQALELGHEVTVLARRPDAVPIRDGKLRVLAGDILSPGSAAAPVAGADAVLSALGIGYSRAPTLVFSRGTANILEAMKAEGVRRFACVSSGGVDSLPGTSAPMRAFHKLVLQRLLRHPYSDIRKMEQSVADSGLDWTIVRAARLTNSRPRGRYRTGIERGAGRGLSISRADLAGYMLSHLADAALYGHLVEIAY
jgi:uncharacterized protein YbjT (DUF2867 family)